MKESSKTLAGLDARKRHLLSLLLKEKGVDPLQAPIPLQPRTRDTFPLSFEQERLWIIEQIEPGNVAYNLPLGLRLEGDLRLGVLEATIGEVVRRHQTLRTTYGSVGGRPVQIVAPPEPLRIPIADLSGLPEALREAETVRVAVQESLLPFDLGRGVLRVHLLRLSATEHALLFTVHHIASDGWSNGILIREVMALYEAYSAGRPSPLPELPVQYVDFAVWQRDTFRGELLEKQLAYWRGQLSGAPVLELPADHPRPAVPSLVGAQDSIQMGVALAEALRALGREEGATLFMLVTAALQTLLARYAGQTDVSVGTPIANRHRTETEALIGFFVNTLVIRADLSGDPPFRELLRRVRKVTAEAFAHQALPFSKVVEALNPERNLSHTPLFQVMLGLGNTPTANLEIPGLKLKDLSGRVDTAMFDLYMLVAEAGERFAAFVIYRTDLFEPATIRRFLGHFEALLRGVVEDPERRLSDIPLLSAAEREQILLEWGDGGAEPRDGRCVHDRIAARAAREPGRIALVTPKGDLTLGEVNRRANRLAHRLIALGAGPETRIGLCLADRAAMITGMLAVLKSGGAYVPLDPAYPQERLAFLAGDARLAAVLVDERTAGLLPDLPGLPRVGFADPTGGDPIEHDPAPRAGLDHAAYVLYTSGSTGRPKGVIIPHRALADVVESNVDLLELDPDDRFLQFASFNFDGSVIEIFPALVTGAALVLPRREAVLAGDDLAAVLCDLDITIAVLPPSVLSTVPPPEERGDSLPRLRTLAVGAERCPAELVRRWAPGRRFINIYGPTEICVDATSWDVDPERLPDAPPPIGRLMPNTVGRIFDLFGAPAPAGVPGELWLGGIGLARGYLGRPDLTAERFVPDPFAATPGERLYRTGDLVRWLPDGEIDYLRRIDHQVKVRGVRIETGEIEALLRQHPQVRDAAVIAGKDAAGTAYLHAFAAIGAAADPRDELRTYLRERLPDFMVPGRISTLGTLPLTPNGKVDRRALADLDAGERGQARREWIEPRPGTETALAALWAEVLGVERVGAADDFFELGGHSLLATQLVARVRDAFQVDLPQRALFEAPILAGLAARLDALAGRGGTGQDQPIAGRAPAAGPYPLSFAQERLWLVDQIDPGNAAYNIPIALDLAGELRPAVLAAALSEIARRHETLRTTFRAVGGKPVQTVTPAAPVPVPLADLGALPPADREAEALRLAHDEAARPFDLESGPVLRALLLRLHGPGEAERHALLFNVHHIASDGWSNGVLVNEVTALYGAFAAGRPSPLPELPVRYVDYAQWQRDRVQGPVLEGELAYWRRQLAGTPALLDLQTDRPRPVVQGFGGASEPWELGPEVTAGLAGLAQREGATLFMLAMAAFQALLSRHTHQTDIAVGTPIAGRDRTELEGLIGFFVNTLVIRTDLAGDPAFREILARVRRVALDAFAHPSVPFEKLVEEINPERSLAHSPLFQVMLALQNAPAPALEIPGLTLGALEVDPGVTKFDLTFTLGEAGDRLAGTLEYRTDLFEAATVRRLLGHFGNVLAGVVADSDRALSELPVLSIAEREQLVAEWNATAFPLDLDRCLHERVEAQAARTPEAPALVSEERELTYRELLARAGALARTLRRLGVGPETIVGLHAERSPDLVAAILGIWQAGGAYVPLEPSYPQERLRYLLEDTAAPVVVTQAALAASLPTPEGVRTVVLEELEPLSLDEASAGPAALPDNLAAVIYTSGSTGRPKGVALHHRGLANRLLWAQETYRLGPADTVLLKASFGFDFSLWEAFAPLIAGARVAVARPGGQQDPAYLAAALRRWSVTVVHFVPSMLALFLRQTGLEEIATLRQAFSGGEALSVELAERFFERFPGVPLDNQYGPTEISIDTTRWTCAPGAESWRVPIGRPIGNTRIHLLDPALQPVPVGVSGKLYVGGEGVARGYLGRPDLTAERFNPDPFGAEGVAGHRLYDTRDLARRRPDGTLEFLGRADTQVKVRGIRIEPGEIEALLRQHPEVVDAAVIADADPAGAIRLLGFFVARPGSALASADLRAHLRAELPEAMLPALLTRLDALPYTASGKLDRLALTRLVDQAGAAAGYVAPRSESEELLAGIWADVLEADRVGVQDDFFDLGGHSLLATQLVSRVREVFQVELPQRALFEAPTVAGLTERIEALRGEVPAAGLIPPLSAAPAAGPERLSFAQERLWVIDQLEPGSNAYNIPVALRLTGAVDIPALAAALSEVVRRHETLRTTFATVLEGGEAVPVQVVHPAAPVPLPVIDLSGLPGLRGEAELAALAQLAGGLPFDLAADPMLRVFLVRLDGGAHALFLTVHHIASDGWSSGVLVRETVALYEAFAAGRPSPLPALPVRYADYARWQRRALQGEALEATLAYWRRQLAGVPVLDLPLDRPRPPVQGPGGAVETLWVPGEVAAGLKALGRREGATLFMVLMAAFQALLARLSGQSDIPVGTPVAGRRRIELEALIGFFVNTLVIRGDLSGDPAVPELLARIRATALDAFAHQDVPFERLVEEVNPERSFSHTPLFQVMLVLLNTPDATVETPGLAFEPLEAGVTTAKFDLTLQLVETADGLGGAVEYRPDLFDRPTVLRLIEHFQILVAGLAAAAPETRLSGLPLLLEAERQAFREWNDTARPEPAWSLEERLAAVAAERSAAPSVLYEGRSFSYGAMEAAILRLAVRLRGLGVGPDVRVGVCAERSPEMVAAVLAVVRAGGAYVPIDPAYPAERVTVMLDDSRAPVLLTQQALLDTLPPFAGSVVLLDGLLDEGADAVPAPLPAPAADPENLLYVIYTSGSTGRPKGVAMTRRALANLMQWQGSPGGPLPGAARTLQFASLSFDVSFQEIFSAWLGDGALVLVSEETRRDPRALLAVIETERVERAFLPVVALRQLAETVAAEGGGGATVRDVIAAGEQLQVGPAVINWFERLPGGRLHNHYGPSETHATTSLTLEGSPRDWPALVPIGRPLPNHQIHLLDGAFQEVPAGSPGEVCISGTGLARGYLERPDLTAERFVPWPEGRLYRTGDLARWRQEGVLEYLGRRDGQVKVRGVRVEIGEVEAALALHPGVRQAAVVAAPGPDGALRLVAYYLAEGVPPTSAELRDFLRGRLPAPYVPSAFLALEAFPLTPSGKVDRRTLAKIEPEASEGAAETYVAPRTQTEELLAGVWAALLGVPRVGVRDSFFDLGGHSLLATQVVSRIRRTFGVELPQRALFEAPTVAELAPQVEEAQRAGLSDALPPLGPIEPGTVEDRLPRLSFAQERLWLLAQMEPDSAAYNLPVALRIAGPLDPAVLAATFAEVARRHATLRTTYDVVPGGGSRPVQIVAPPGPVPLPAIDLAALPAASREAETLRLAEDEANRPFDLRNGPVLWVRLIRLAAADHALLLNVHHIASDGWSNGVLVREVTELYGAFADGLPPALPELPVQYVDFARWQRRTLRGEALEATLAYWRRQLAGVPVLELPADRPRPAVQSSAGAVELAEVAAPLAAGLRDRVRSDGATLFMGVMAAVQALLHRYSGQSDFAVGTPVAGRSRLETEGLIGFFVNTLVLRADLDGAPSFAELLRRVRKTALEAFAYQDLPFEKLVEELNPERSLAHTPLFQVMAALQNAPAAALETSELTFTPIEAPTHSAKFDLTLSLSEAAEGLMGTVEYRTDLFEAATVRRMMGHLSTLLESALAEPDRPVAELPLLSGAERAQLLVDWNRTKRPDLDAGLLHELFESQVRAVPDVPAVWAAGTTVSYRELNERADRLARRLASLGAGPEVRVGVCQDRSIEMIVAVLGVLKAGGAYVPLDPAYPADRLAFMAEDAGLAAVVVNDRTADRAPGHAQMVGAEEPGEGRGGLARGLDPDTLAYVIYTSGSTGRPKGVAVSHRGAVNTIRATIERLRLGPGERFLQFASLSFDGSVAEIFSALGSGACLCLIGREALPSGEVLAAALRAPEVTVALIPPSVLGTLGEERFPALHTLNVSAEKCPAEMVRQWAPGRRFLNLYGPTEASVYMTVWEAGEGAPGAGFEAPPPIGRPIANSRVYVLDRSGAPVPVGIPGELLLGGLCLARGYFERPEKTAETFVPDPFAADWGETGSRLYRTGDLCRWRPDGHLEMLGRIDHQVKVRGFRIELGEIESVLLDHPAVRRAAVLSRPGPGGARLVAYVVPDPDLAADYDPLTPALRAHLRDRLPDFMAPAAFVELSELPLTTSGKLDRAALQDPGGARPDLATSYVAPHGGTESALAEIWQEALGVERVGIEDNFFDLGGHSLLMVEVQAKVRERLAREVSLLELFRYPNIAALARFLEGEAKPAIETAARTAVRPGTRDVAVIGMAARFPKAPDLETFWRQLRAGTELITFFTPEELLAAGVPRERIADPAYVPASGALEDADRFDANLFDVSPREAQLMDPQQRILLECAAEALDRAGYGAGSPALAGEDGRRGPRVGVYAGGGMSTYGLQNLFGRPVGSSLEITLGNDKDYLATRVAYKLNLRGPAFTVQTACSTSLVAIHLACQGLLDGECDLALAGGVTAQFPMTEGYVYEENGILSDDGHTHTFDARAKGTVNSNGAGVVVLKPLAAALADGDVVHAVIKGTAINNDGSDKIGFTAPSEEGQAQVIAEAQALAGVGPETIGYVETHGTATPVGDPIEVAALTRAFRDRGAPGGPRRGFCYLGSVKTNLGHTGSAAGVAGFLKAALAVERGEIPPHLGFETPNPVLDLESGPFRVNTALEPWPGGPAGTPRRAAVSSFGLGGTNAHAVLEQAPVREPSGPGRTWQLVSLSARTETALEAATDRLVRRLREGGKEEPLADIAFTLHTGRKSWEHRRTVVCRDRAEALAALEARDPQKVLGSALRRGGISGRPVAFVFSGLGEQYPGMAAGLYRDEHAFREAFDHCAELLASQLGADLREILFSGPAEEGEGGTDLRRLLGRAPAAALGALDRTALLQPALFAVEYALAALWMEWGVEPRAVIGYSLGEYVAACVASVLTLEDALRLVAERARLIDALPEGAMLALSLPEAEVLPLLDGSGLSLAAVNGPALSVVAGPAEAVAALEERLATQGIAHRRLRTTHAFHSRMMEPAAGPLAAFVCGLDLQPPRIPYVSNVTGTWITPEQATYPGYWAEHLVRPVRFSEGIGELWRGAERVLLEIGPGGSLATLALQHPAAEEAADPVALATLRSSYEKRPDQAFLLGTLGKLWLAGVRIDWRAVYARERRRRVELPAYPFERERYWIEGGIEAAPDLPMEAAGSPTGLYLPSWRRARPLPASADLADGRWLVFVPPGSRLAERVIGRLPGSAAVVSVASQGTGFQTISYGRYAVDPRRTEDYDALLAALLECWGAPPDRIFHLWTAIPPQTDGAGLPLPERFAHAQDLGFYSLLFLTQSLARWQMSAGREPSALRALVASTGLHRVTGADEPRFEYAALAALCRSLTLEIPGVVCRAVDVSLPLRSARAEERLADLLLAELLVDEDAVAYRGTERWVRSFEPIREIAEPEPPLLPPGGSVVIAGRSDALLLGAAGAVARSTGARLAMLEDRPTGENAAAPDAFAADWSDPAALRAAFDRIAAEVGPVAGIIAVDVPGSEPPPVAVAYITREHADGFLRGTAGRLAALSAALEEQEPAFCLLVSSLAAVAPETGRALQGTLDAVTEAYAGQRETEGEPAWTAVSWDRAAGDGAGLTAEEAGRTLLRILGQGPVPQVVLSPQDLAARIRRAAAPDVTETGPALTRHARPNLRNAYVAPESETERRVAEIWQGLLGIEQIGMHDSFFDLGGDSLLATQVFTRVREIYGVDIPLTTFFELPTPAALAARVDEVRAQGETETDRLARMLEELESLSPEEVERMLAERGLSDFDPDSLDA